MQGLFDLWFCSISYMFSWLNYLYVLSAFFMCFWGANIMNSMGNISVIWMLCHGRLPYSGCGVYPVAGLGVMLESCRQLLPLISPFLQDRSSRYCYRAIDARGGRRPCVWYTFRNVFFAPKGGNKQQGVLWLQGDHTNPSLPNAGHYSSCLAGSPSIWAKAYI